ncbi:MAG: hypothetical protein A3J29_17385, partial [Acidobacteria bacterium RIFCSPLOWO2_12_FULL_67_14b]
MKIAIPKEYRPGEARVAASPDVVKKLVGLGFQVTVETGAGGGASFTDAAYKDAGAEIAHDEAVALKDAELVLKVQRPLLEAGRNEVTMMKKGSILVAHLQALVHPQDVKAYAEAGITAFAMELMPRITRAQSMDILSSQSNLAGYRAVTDAAYKDAGAEIAHDEAVALKDAELVLKVQRPLLEAGRNEVTMMKKGSILVAHLQALVHPQDVKAYAEAGITAFAMELMPRITRAQSMDILSSQSNLAGYRAVLDAAYEFGRAFPMMMTAAGTVPPARVLVLGAGVAGLQAIATAKRLGGVVTGYDVRPAVKEQVESLGGRFLQVDADATKDAETAGGYAKEMGEAYQRKQAQVLHESAKKQDIVICTALIPGRKAPVLVTEAMVKDMKPGSVIVD